MKKILLFLVIFNICGYFVYKFVTKIDDHIVSEIENQGRKIFGTEVKVDDFEINIKNGSASIQKISVANPTGEYTSAHALTFENIHAQFDYKTLTITEIIVSQPHVYAEYVNSKLNIEELSSQAKKFSARQATGKNSESEQTNSALPTDSDSSSEEENPVILTIDYIALENIKVDLISDQLKETKQFGIDQVQARDLSGTTGEIGNQITDKLLDDLYVKVITQSVKAFGLEKFDDLKEIVKDKLKDLFD